MILQVVAVFNLALLGRNDHRHDDVTSHIEVWPMYVYAMVQPNITEGFPH